MSEKWNEIKLKLVLGCRILDREGILDELGHFSARLPEGNLVVMNGKMSPGQSREKDLVVLDLEGRKIEGGTEPAKEIPLHLAIYQRRPEVQAIVHSHAHTSILLGATGHEPRPLDNLGAMVYGERTPIFEELGLVDTFEMGFRIVEAMAGGEAILLRGHGNIVAGRTIEEACVLAVWADKAARLQYQALTLGNPRWLPGDEVAKIREQVRAGKGFERAWSYFVWKIGRP